MEKLIRTTETPSEAGHYHVWIDNKREIVKVDISGRVCRNGKKLDLKDEIFSGVYWMGPFRRDGDTTMKGEKTICGCYGDILMNARLKLTGQAEWISVLKDKGIQFLSADVIEVRATCDHCGGRIDLPEDNVRVYFGHGVL